MKRLFTSTFLMLALLFALCSCGFEQVDTGYRGVKTVWGEVDLKAGSLPEGFYTYNPISTSIHEINVQTQAREIKVNTYTRDVQQANIVIRANYHLDPTKAHVMYKEVGMHWDEKLVPLTVEGDLKKVIGQYDAVILIEHRGKATEEAKTAIRSSLAMSGIILDGLEMVNIQYLKEFEKSVEDKVVASQKAVEEANRTKQIGEQAKQKIIAAEAEARSMTIRAQALMANAKLVEYEAIQKWDGKLPQYNFGASTPFISLK